MKTADYDYPIPERAIAQEPVEPRDAARLMVLARDSGSVRHAKFSELGDYLNPGDLLVVNQTRVIPARLNARKSKTGGQVEILLLRPVGEKKWEALVGGRRIRPGALLLVENRYQAKVLDDLGGARRVIFFKESVTSILQSAGRVPLPPYIKGNLKNPERYQTVYAKSSGSVAAPTAGLHFTQHLMAGLERKGVNLTSVTLHIGLDTFAPIVEDLAEEHPIHTEWCEVSLETAETINRTRKAGNRIVAVGTSSVRALETAASYSVGDNTVGEFAGDTDLFILPGYQFKVTDAMITNFHLPKTTLLMLVSAFAGREQILACYNLALESGYRFYSFGDAMLIE